jgi:small subunit ribosomal protein S4
MLTDKGIPPWLRLDPNAFSGRVLNLPTRQDLELPFDDALVVEYYQR